MLNVNEYRFYQHLEGLFWWLSRWRICLQCRKPRFDSWSGRSPGEGIGYPLQYSWTSLVAQQVKNLPAMLETWVQPLSWEDPLEKGIATHSNIMAWRIPPTVESMGSQRVRHNLAITTNIDTNSISFVELLWWRSELIYIECLEQWQTHCKHSEYLL